MIIQDTSKAMPHLPGTRATSRLEHPMTQELVLSHTLHPLRDTPKVGLRLLETQAALVGAPVAHVDMCGSGRWLPAATCATLSGQRDLTFLLWLLSHMDYNCLLSQQLIDFRGRA